MFLWLYTKYHCWYSSYWSTLLAISYLASWKPSVIVSNLKKSSLKFQLIWYTCTIFIWNGLYTDVIICRSCTILHTALWRDRCGLRHSVEWNAHLHSRPNGKIPPPLSLSLSLSLSPCLPYIFLFSCLTDFKISKTDAINDITDLLSFHSLWVSPVYVEWLDLQAAGCVTELALRVANKELKVRTKIFWIEVVLFFHCKYRCISYF